MNVETFLFGPHPLYLETFDKIFLADSILSFVTAIVLLGVISFKKINPVKLNFLRRVKNLTLTYGILGLLWTGFRYENANYLSWRFWALIIAAAAIIWLVRIIVYLVRNYKQDVENYKRQQIKKKYLNG